MTRERRFRAVYCCCAGPPTPPDPGGPAPQDIVSLLCSRPPSVGWRLQSEVETELGIQKDGVRDFFMDLGRRKDGAFEAATIELLSAGVYRELLFVRPKRVWGLAFVGTGGPVPGFPQGCNSPIALDTIREANSGGPGQAAVGASAAAGQSGSEPGRAGAEVVEVVEMRYVCVSRFSNLAPMCAAVTDKRFPLLL